MNLNTDPLNLLASIATSESSYKRERIDDGSHEHDRGDDEFIINYPKKRVKRTDTAHLVSPNRPKHLTWAREDLETQRERSATPVFLPDDYDETDIWYSVSCAVVCCYHLAFCQD